MAPHYSTLAWKIPWMEEPGRLQSMGSLRVRLTERLHFHFSLSCFGEGNGNPLQYSWLENPRDRGAQWASVYGVARSRTRLKRLSISSSSHFVMSDSLWPRGQQSAKLLCPWRFSRQQQWSGLPILSSRWSSQPSNQTQVTSTAGVLFTDWAIRVSF